MHSLIGTRGGYLLNPFLVVYCNFTIQAWNSNKCELFVIEVQFTSNWMTFYDEETAIEIVVQSPWGERAFLRFQRSCSESEQVWRFELNYMNLAIWAYWNTRIIFDLDLENHLSCPIIWMLQVVAETETNLSSRENKKRIHQVRTGALRRQAADQQVEQVCLQAWPLASQTWGLRSSGGFLSLCLDCVGNGSINS